MSVRHYGSGPEPLLALHCTMAQGAAWAGFARHMDKRLSLIAPDLVGHGSGPAPDHTRDYHDQAKEAARGHLPSGRYHLIGHSLGATIALRLALDQPAQVRSLTLIEPVLFCAANGPGRAAHDALFAPLPKALAQGDARAAARIFLNLWGAQKFDDLMPPQQTYITDRVWIPPATEPALVHDRAHLLPRLPSLTIPTLLLQGAMSPPVIAEINAALAASLPNAHQITLPTAGHMAPITHPEATAKAHASFLDTL